MSFYLMSLIDDSSFRRFALAALGVVVAGTDVDDLKKVVNETSSKILQSSLYLRHHINFAKRHINATQNIGLNVAFCVKNVTLNVHQNVT